jgi:hypothetical protein
MTSLSPNEQVQMVRQIFSLMKILTDEEALAGLILTNSSFDGFKQILRSQAVEYKPSGLDFDPHMENSFVVDGMLILRGTQIQ